MWCMNKCIWWVDDRIMDKSEIRNNLLANWREPFILQGFSSFSLLFFFFELSMSNLIMHFSKSEVSVSNIRIHLYNNLNLPMDTLSFLTFYFA